jgi:hypothetical protein
MQLNVLISNSSFESLRKEIEMYFGGAIRWIKEEHSIFESFQVRPIERVFIPQIWSYRIIKYNGIWSFGTIKNPPL